MSEQIKTNNNEIRKLIGEYKQIEPKCREGVGMIGIWGMAMTVLVDFCGKLYNAVLYLEQQIGI